MTRCQKYLYQTEDHVGDLWNVFQERPTEHGWPLLLGRRAELADGEKSLGGTAVILTKELAAHLERMRMTPGRSNLPISTATISNLRRVLQYNFYTDIVTLWDDRVYDLTAMQKDATEVYGVSDQTIWRHGRKRGVVRVQASWSEEDKEQLRRFVAAGFSAREIAREMGRSPYAAAYMRRALLGMISTARRPWTEAEKEELLRLRSKGMEIRTIAEQLGRTEYAVGSICHEIGVFSPKRNRPWSEEEKTRLMLLIQAGHDEQYMSETLGRTRAAIHQMRQRLQRKKRSR